MSCEVKRNSSILSKLVLINHSRGNTDLPFYLSKN